MNTPSAGFSWLDSTASHRNTFALIRRRVRLEFPPRSAHLHIFADTRYRLRVNGSTIGHGPARFHPSFPEFDSYDLAALLREGDNDLLVEVWSAESVNFQSLTAPAIFWADGEIIPAKGAKIPLSTPGDWTGLISTAREHEAVPLSFAIGPVEILDTTRLAHELNQDAAALVSIEAPHGQPVPRSTPMPAKSARPPDSLHYCGPATNHGENRFGAFRFFPDFVPPHAGGTKTRHALCAAWLHSSCDQTVTTGIFWSDVFLNGVELIRHDDPALGNRQTSQARFQKGWNFLAAKLPVFGEVWGFPLGLPAASGLIPRPAQSLDSPAGFLMSAQLDSNTQLFPGLAGLQAPPENMQWQCVPADSIRLAPARDVGWDLPLHQAPAPQPWPGDGILLQTGPDGLAVLTTGFDTEFLGHPSFEISCPHAATVDVSTGEFLRADGTLDSFKGLFSVHSTDRYEIPPGKYHIEGFHNRGGCHLQLNIRTLPDTEIQVTGLEILEFKTPSGSTGIFESNDDFWNWCWSASEKTLHASLDDIWCDSPWREQGCYLGDSLVQFHAHTCLSNDMRLPARVLRLWAQCQRLDGQMPAVMPAHMTNAHPDFTLLYIRFVRDYWAHTGDSSLVEELWQAIGHILKSPTWIETDSGLIATNGGKVFIDWSVEEQARQGASSVLNAFFLQALDNAAELAHVLGKPAEAILERRSKLHAAILRNLWSEPEGRFLCTILPDGTPVSTRALHGNALAFATGLATPEQRERILPWLLAELEDNARKIVRHRESQPTHPRTNSGQLEPYFLFHLLGPLAEAGHADAAESLIADMWGLMRERGATTLWESILQTYFDDGSRCHSWAAAPLIFASRHILGATRPIPGNPESVRIQPLLTSLDSVRGSIPHPSGSIHISWHRKGPNFTLEVDHPAKVRLEILPPPHIDPLHFQSIATLR